MLVGAPERSAGSASGLQSTMVQVGSAVGVAVMGVVFLGPIAKAATAVARADFSGSLQRTLYYEAGIFAITALLVFLMPRARRDEETGG